MPLPFAHDHTYSGSSNMVDAYKLITNYSQLPSGYKKSTVLIPCFQ